MRQQEKTIFTTRPVVFSPTFPKQKFKLLQFKHNESVNQPTAYQTRLYLDVEFLTSLRPFRNYRNLESLEKVCEYLRKEFKDAGYETQDQKWMAEGNEYTNVIASYQPQKTKRLIVGAHYDVAGEQPGADDNASAVAGLLETARLVAELQPELDFRIDFVAFCLEEPPFFSSDKMGSYIHAQSLSQNKADVLGMICYEMIGYFSEEPGSQDYPSADLAKIYPDKGNFIIVVGIEQHKSFHQEFYRNMAEGSRIDVQEITFPVPVGYAAMSDHMNYWHFGFPALMINDTSMLRNHNYHLASDSIETLNFEKMAEVVNSSFRAILKLNKK
mgnify:CR=1 FL=1